MTRIFNLCPFLQAFIGQTFKPPKKGGAFRKVKEKTYKTLRMKPLNVFRLNLPAL